MNKRALKFLPLLIMTLGVQAQYQPLYSKKIPNYIDAPNEESTAVTGGISRISKVSIPGYAFYPANRTSPSPCVIICPGGGYTILAAEHEGTDVARYFNNLGIHAIVLKYRIPSSKNQEDKKIAPLQDAQQAIYLARKNAKEWGIDPTKIGIMGFSAGGHLATSLGVHYDDVKIKISKKTSLRPDFQILGYPVVSISKFPHMGSRNNLLSPDTTSSNISYFSNELHINSNTPPAFLVHAKDDKVVPIENAYLYAEALKMNGVASEVFVYETGGHGFGLVNKTSPLKWTDALEKWMTAQGILVKK
jgi:acetyl esterase/lipase